MTTRGGARRAAAAAAVLLLGVSACSTLPHGRGAGIETGMASWYGRESHGQPTSSREIFNMNDMTAAHRTLPFGTHVMVTNLQNGRSVVVRINDRGPFVRGRIIDLSYEAASVLGFVGPGIARVRLEVLRGYREPATSKRGGIWVQVGAFTAQENAYAVKRRLDKLFRDVVVTRTRTSRATYFRVRVRADQDSAEKMARRLASEGYPVIIIRE